MLLGERYRTTEILGHGGMGEVYRGCDELLDRPVAVKLLRPDLSDRSAAARLRREARTAAVVKDPHVVAVYDFGHSNGEYFLVMELLEGRSLAQELAAHGPFDVDRALGIVRQAAAGLAAAHRRQIVHRDIKPDNLLIDVDGSVKIADFGIARSPTDPATTSSGLILGTSQYLAPERAVGRPATPASDVYALGCVMYQLLTGQPPFVGDDPTTILSQHVQAEPVIPEGLPAAVAGLLLSMLAKDPADRPAAEDISGWTAPETPTVELPRPDHSRRSVYAVLAALLVAGSAVTAGVLADQQSDETVIPPGIAPAPAQQVLPSSRPTTVPTVTITTSARATGKARPATSTAASNASPQTTKATTGPHKPGKGKGHGKPDKPGKH